MTTGRGTVLRLLVARLRRTPTPDAGVGPSVVRVTVRAYPPGRVAELALQGRVTRWSHCHESGCHWHHESGHLNFGTSDSVMVPYDIIYWYNVKPELWIVCI